MSKDSKIDSNCGDFKTAKGAITYLKSLRKIDKKDINLAEASMAMGLIFLPGINVDRYRNLILKLEDEIKTSHKEKLRKRKAEDSLKLRVETLRDIVYEKYEFSDDRENFDNIDNINFIRMLETRSGIPVALGILLMHLSEKAGWDCAGINFPGHFLLRLDMGSERMIIDPFDKAKPMEAHDLRDLLKSILGDKAELSHEFYEPVSKIEVLFRLQNNLKARFIEAADYAGAIIAVESIEAFYPEEYRLYLDKGVLYAKISDADKSIEALEHYIELTPDPNEKYQAQVLLEQIKITML